MAHAASLAQAPRVKAAPRLLVLLLLASSSCASARFDGPFHAPDFAPLPAPGSSGPSASRLVGGVLIVGGLVLFGVAATRGDDDRERAPWVVGGALATVVGTALTVAF